MPNWCENYLSVIGNKEEVRKFYEKGLEESPYKKQGTWSLFPYHPYLGEWNYDWCCDNWGTKWDIDFMDYGEANLYDDIFTACFETAWAPPIDWLMKVQNDYPTLKFDLEYSESGTQFRGQAYTIQEGDYVGIIDNELEWINPFGGKVKFTNIAWDQENAELPKEVTLEVDEIDSDFDIDGADLLSDEYGYLVKSYSYEILTRNEDEL